MSGNGWKEFIDLLAGTDSRAQVNQLLKVLMTAQERDDCGHRLLIVRSLLEGEQSQRAIAEQFGVSLATVTRGSNELKRTSKTICKLLE